MTTAGDFTTQQETGEAATGTTGLVQEGMRRIGIRGNLFNRGLDFVRRNPILALLATVALGLIFGRRTRRGMGLLKRDVSVAMYRTEATLLGTVLAILAGLRRMFRSASHTASSRWAFTRGYSKPLVKTVRRFRNRFALTPRMVIKARHSRGGLFRTGTQWRI